MAPSQLDGREPIQTTRHFRDRHGRLIRSETTSEPRFTDQDRGELLALVLYRDTLCPLCGRPLDICTSMEGVGPDFEATYTACRPTAQILAMQRALANSKTASNDSASFLFTTTTRE